MSVWWLVLAGVWLATVSTVSVAELVVGLIAALVCAVAASAGRWAADGRWRVRAGWSRWFLVTLSTVVGDTVRVLGRCLSCRPLVGELGVRRWVGTVPADVGEELALRAGWTAVAEVVLSMGPAMYVMGERLRTGANAGHDCAGTISGGGVGDGGGLFAVHALTPGPHRVERAIGR